MFGISLFLYSSAPCTVIALTVVKKVLNFFFYIILFSLVAVFAWFFFCLRCVDAIAMNLPTVHSVCVKRQFDTSAIAVFHRS